MVRKAHPFWDLSDACFAPYLDAPPGTVGSDEAAAAIVRFRAVLDGPAIALDDVIDARTEVTSAKNRTLRKLFGWGRLTKKA